MKQNQSNLYQFLICDSAGAGRPNLTVSVKLSQDNGVFVDATNPVTEVDVTNAPGLYSIMLTATECTCNVLAVQATLANGTNPVVMDSINLDPELSVEDVWGYEKDGLTMAERVFYTHNGLYNWQLTGSTLTLYDSTEQELKSFAVIKDSDDNIIKVSPITVEAE